MKNCSVCGRSFPDEYSFCLTDGTPLGGSPILTEEPTVVKERPIVKRSRRSILLFLLAALLSLSLGVSAAVLYYFWPRHTTSQQIAPASPSPVASATLASISPSPTPQPTTPRPSPSPDSTPGERLDDVPNEPGSDPGITRITFRPGRAQETVEGTVRDQRSFLLTARPGQTLSARVDSSDDCVNFAEGDDSVRFRTQAGDNSLTLLNSCDTASRFTLSVRIR